MYPGGLIDWREDPETAAKREVWEEVGIKVDEVKFLKTYSHKRYAGNSTCHFFEVTVDSNEFTIDGVEIAEAAWFQLNDLPEPMTQPIFEV